MSWLINKFKAKETQPEENIEPAQTEQPQPEQEESSISSILKSVLSVASLGSDVLSAGISLPASLYEPLSLLQRQIEMIEYSDILDLAAETDSSLDRMAYVAAFATSVYPSTERYWADFNPILGETFEFIDEEKNIRSFSEQVSHHPPISAVHIEGANWQFWQNSAAATSFQGNSIEVDTHGKTHIYFPATKDHFVYTNPKSKLHNLILGKMWIEHYGELDIRNVRTGETCLVTYKKAGFFGSVNYKISGAVKDAKGRPRISLDGLWNNHVTGTWLNNNETRDLWNIHTDNTVENKYQYSRFTEKLLNMNDELNQLLPPTDSRLRCDRILLEQGESKKATRVKRTMEERQRADKKARIEEDEEWVPTYFHKIPEEDGTEIWVYCGDYWDQREQKLSLLHEGAASEELLNGGNSLGSAADFRSYEIV